MSRVAIRKALETDLLAWKEANCPNIEVAWENIQFKPKKKTYIRPVLYPVGTSNPSIGADHYREYGNFSVKIFDKNLNAGSRETDTMADSLCDWFYRGKALLADGSTTYIQNTPFSHFLDIDDGWIVVYVEIPYYCDTIKQRNL